MSLLKTAFTSAALLAGGLFAMTPDTADAQIRFQIGGGNGYGYGNGGYRGHNHGGSGFRSSNYGGFGNRYGGYNGLSSGRRYNSGYSRQNVWHDTSHYDYHPTTVVPHGNHYDVIPGHYDFHQTGHYDRVRGGFGGHSGHNH